MILLIFGLALWIVPHLLRRLAPAARESLTRRFGEGPSKGVIAAPIGLSILLMILGYRGADYVALYTPPAWTVHLNNLLMYGSIVLFGMGNSKGTSRAWLRHPMLSGLALWAFAHLLVNGDLASLLLFGGLGLWALAEMALINRAVPDWTRPEPGTRAGDVRLLVIAAVIFAVVALIHTWLGYYPFPG